jgi:transposase-like protein
VGTSLSIRAERGFDNFLWGSPAIELKFGPAFSQPAQVRPQLTGTWHLNEMGVSIQGKRMYLWRAVDSEVETLDALFSRGGTRPRP